MSARPGLSACIITLNEADRIDACLDSLSFCDEIIVVDSGSTDDTRTRAAAHGADVRVRAFDGYRSQKAFAVGLAKNDWVLCLDADERVTAARIPTGYSDCSTVVAAAGVAIARSTNTRASTDPSRTFPAISNTTRTD